jgi:putative oxidoreductase
MGVIDRLERRVAQALLGATFIKLGFDAAIAPGSQADKAAAIGLPSAELAVRANGAAMMAGGAALTLDKLPRLAALGLITSMIPATWRSRLLALRWRRTQGQRNPVPQKCRPGRRAAAGADEPPTSPATDDSYRHREGDDGRESARGRLSLLTRWIGRDTRRP